MSPNDDTSYTTTLPNKKATYTLLFLKLLELCLIICCIALIDEPVVNSQLQTYISVRVAALSYVTFGCLLIYTAIYLIMLLFEDATSWRTNALWSLAAFILYLAVTIGLFCNWSITKERNYWHPNMHRLDLILATASVSLVTSLTYLLDFIITMRFGINGYLE